MCKLQVIRKNLTNIVEDKTRFCSQLSHIALNNIPYYLTIGEYPGKILLEFAYLDTYDKEPVHLPETNVMVFLGKSSGRLYSVEIQTQDNKIGNKDWEKIKKELFSIVPESNTSLCDLKQLMKILQEEYTAL